MMGEIVKFLCLIKRNFAQVGILSITLLSFFWLFLMSFRIGECSMPISLEYRVFLENADYEPIKNPQITISEGLQHEDALFKTFAEAEEHLRGQLNVWLTIIGFFGVVFGLLLPLINYLLQRQTLADERARMVADIEKRFNEVVEKVDRHVNEAITKADSALNTVSRVEKNMADIQAMGGGGSTNSKSQNTVMETMENATKERS